MALVGELVCMPWTREASGSGRTRKAAATSMYLFAVGSRSGYTERREAGRRWLAPPAWPGWVLRARKTPRTPKSLRGETFQRAGDRTRTGDVQLGKPASPTLTSAHQRKPFLRVLCPAIQRQPAPGRLLPGTLPRKAYHFRL